MDFAISLVGAGWCCVGLLLGSLWCQSGFRVRRCGVACWMVLVRGAGAGCERGLWGFGFLGCCVLVGDII